MQITMELEKPAARALAEWLRRYTWTDLRSASVNAEEARLIRSGLDTVRQALIENGFNPI